MKLVLRSLIKILHSLFARTQYLAAGWNIVTVPQTFTPHIFSAGTRSRGLRPDARGPTVADAESPTPKARF